MKEVIEMMLIVAILFIILSIILQIPIGKITFLFGVTLVISGIALLFLLEEKKWHGAIVLVIGIIIMIYGGNIFHMMSMIGLFKLLQYI